MGEETGQIAEFGLLKSVNQLVLRLEQLRVKLNVGGVQYAESLAYVPVVAQVGSVLHAALENHVAEFDLLAWSDLKLQ